MFGCWSVHESGCRQQISGCQKTRETTKPKNESGEDTDFKIIDWMLREELFLVWRIKTYSWNDTIRIHYAITIWAPINTDFIILM